MDTHAFGLCFLFDTLKFWLLERGVFDIKSPLGALVGFPAECKMALLVLAI